MKTLITLIVISAGLAFSQTITDSSQIRKENQVREQSKFQNQEMKQIQEQVGPKDNPKAQVNNERKRKDVFIDKDGDGICDSRQSGMSFNKLRKRLGSGQKGPGGPGGTGSGHNGGSGNMNGGGR